MNDKELIDSILAEYQSRFVITSFSDGATGMAKYTLNLLSDMCKELRSQSLSDTQEVIKGLAKFCELLTALKPNRAPLENALNYVEKSVLTAASEKNEVDHILESAMSATQKFTQHIETCQTKTSDNIAKYLSNIHTIMTMCRSTTVEQGILRLHQQKSGVEVIVLETRPGFDGRITARKLGEYGIPTTIIVDAAAQVFITQVDAVVVGADVITEDGKIINRIGTHQLAVLAKVSKIPFFVTTNSYALRTVAFAQDIKIEPRLTEEIVPTGFLTECKNVSAVNLPDDITPAVLVTKIITDLGIFQLTDFMRYLRTHTT